MNCRLLLAAVAVSCAIPAGSLMAQQRYANNASLYRGASHTRQVSHRAGCGCDSCDVAVPSCGCDGGGCGKCRRICVPPLIPGLLNGVADVLDCLIPCKPCGPCTPRYAPRKSLWGSYCDSDCGCGADSWSGGPSCGCNGGGGGVDYYPGNTISDPFQDDAPHTLPAPPAEEARYRRTTSGRYARSATPRTGSVLKRTNYQDTSEQRGNLSVLTAEDLRLEPIEATPRTASPQRLRSQFQVPSNPLRR